jgi:hypothetical protein
MTFQPALKQLAFVLPYAFKSAELTFLKRFGQELQFHMVVEQNTQSRQVVSTHQLSSGFWHVILDWWEGNDHYWKEQDILVN